MSVRAQYALACRLLRLRCYSLYRMHKEFRIDPVILTRAYESVAY